MSHYSTADLAGATIQWQTSDGQTGVLPLDKVPAPGAVAAEATLHFKAAQAEAVTRQYLRLQLVSAAGATLAQNRYSLRCVSATAAGPGGPTVMVAIHDPLNQLQGLRAALAANGIAVADENCRGRPCGSPLCWMSQPKRSSPRGGPCCCWLEAARLCPQGGPLQIAPRAGSDLAGDWVNNFNWVLSSSPLWKPLSPVIDSSILGWEAASVMPEYVIDGLQDPQDVLAGVFYGWLNVNRGYLADVRQGPGRMLVTTFRFQGYGHDPFATMLLHQMLIIAASGKT